MEKSEGYGTVVIRSRYTFSIIVELAYVPGISCVVNLLITSLISRLCTKSQSESSSLTLFKPDNTADMDNEEMALEALKVIKLRDSLLERDTREVRRLKVEKKVRNRYNETSYYKKLLRSGRIDLIDKETRHNLFTPYERLQSAYYDYYKPRKQREDEDEVVPNTQLSTSDDFYDDNTDALGSEQQTQKQPHPQHQLQLQQGYFPPPALSYGPPQASPQPSLIQPGPFPLMYGFNMGFPMGPFNQQSQLPSATTGYFPPNMYASYLTPDGSSQLFPQPNNSAYLGLHQHQSSSGSPALQQPAQQQPPPPPSAPPPPASYNSFSSLQHGNGNGSSMAGPASYLMNPYKDLQNDNEHDQDHDT
jgi:hypothetical protein